MDFTNSQIFSYLTAYFGFIGGIWFLFSKSEDTLNEETRNTISNWLKNVKVVEPVENWSGQFANVFDMIFGDKHLSWKCFFRSCLASLFGVFILILFIPGILTTQYLYEGGILGLFYLQAFALLFNFLPDYTSLLQTRFLLNIAKKKRAHISLLLIIDLIFTVMIWFIFLAVIITIWNVFKHSPDLDINMILNFTRIELIFFSNYFKFQYYHIIDEGHSVPYSVYLYSTFFTSIWLWIYAISGFIVKFAQKLDISWVWLKKILDVDKKPLRSMAMVAIMVITIIFFVVVPLVRYF